MESENSQHEIKYLHPRHLNHNFNGQNQQEQEMNSIERKTKKKRRQQQNKTVTKLKSQRRKNETDEAKCKDLNPVFSRNDDAGDRFTSCNVVPDFREKSVKAMVCEMKQKASVSDCLSLPANGDHAAETKLLLKGMCGLTTPRSPQLKGKVSTKSAKKKLPNIFLKKHFLSLSRNDKLVIKTQLSLWFPCILKRPSFSDIRTALSRIGDRVVHHASRLRLMGLNQQLSESKAQRALFRKELSSRTTDTFKSNVVPECQKIVTSFSRGVEVKTTKTGDYKNPRTAVRDFNLHEGNDEVILSDIIQADKNGRHCFPKDEVSYTKETSNSQLDKGEEKPEIQSESKSPSYNIPNWFYKMLAKEAVIDLRPAFTDSTKLNSVEIIRLKTMPRRIILQSLACSESDIIDGYLHVCIKEQENTTSCGQINKCLPPLNLTQGSLSYYSKTSKKDSETATLEKVTPSCQPTPVVNSDVDVSKSESRESLPALNFFPPERSLSFRHVWKFTGTRTKSPRRRYIKSSFRNRIEQIHLFGKQNRDDGDTRRTMEWRDGMLLKRPMKTDDTRKKAGLQIWRSLFKKKYSQGRFGKKGSPEKDGDKHIGDRDKQPDGHLSRQMSTTKTRLFSVLGLVSALLRSRSNNSVTVMENSTNETADTTREACSRQNTKMTLSLIKGENVRSAKMGKPFSLTSDLSKKERGLPCVKKRSPQKSSGISPSKCTSTHTIKSRPIDSRPRSGTFSEKSMTKFNVHKKARQRLGKKSRVHDVGSHETHTGFKCLRFGETNYLDYEPSASLNQNNSALYGSDETSHNFGEAPIHGVGKCQEVCMGTTAIVGDAEGMSDLTVSQKENVIQKESEAKERRHGGTCKEKGFGGSHLFSELVSQYRNQYNVKDKTINTSPVYSPENSFGEHGEPQSATVSYSDELRRNSTAATGNACNDTGNDLHTCKEPECGFILNSSPKMRRGQECKESSNDEPLRRSLKAFIKKQWRSGCETEPLESGITLPRPLPRTISSALNQCPIAKQTSPRRVANYNLGGGRKNKSLNTCPKVRSPGRKKKQDHVNLHSDKEPTYELMCAQRRENYKDLCAKIEEHYEITRSDKQPGKCDSLTDRVGQEFNDSSSDPYCRLSGASSRLSPENVYATEKSSVSCYDGTSSHSKPSPRESTTRSLFSIPECPSPRVLPGDLGNESQTNHSRTQVSDNGPNSITSLELDKFSMSEIERVLAGSSSLTSTESSKLDAPQLVFSTLEKVLTRFFPEEYKNVSANETVKKKSVTNKLSPKFSPADDFHFDFNLGDSLSENRKITCRGLSPTTSTSHEERRAQPMSVETCKQHDTEQNDTKESPWSGQEKNILVDTEKSETSKTDTKEYESGKKSDCYQNDKADQYGEDRNEEGGKEVQTSGLPYIHDHQVHGYSTVPMSQQELSKNHAKLQQKSVRGKKELQATLYHNKEKISDMPREDLDKLEPLRENSSFNHGGPVSPSLSQQAYMTGKTLVATDENFISCDKTENRSPNGQNIDEEIGLPSRLSFSSQTSRSFVMTQHNSQAPNSTSLETQTYARCPGQDATLRFSDRPSTYLQTSPRFSKTFHPLKHSLATQISPKRTGSCAMQTSPQPLTCRNSKQPSSPWATNCAQPVQTSQRFACDKSNTCYQNEAWENPTRTSFVPRPSHQRHLGSSQYARSPSPNRLHNCHCSYGNFQGQSYNLSTEQQTRREAPYNPADYRTCEPNKTLCGKQDCHVQQEKCSCCDVCLKQRSDKISCFPSPCEVKKTCFQVIPLKTQDECCAQEQLQSPLKEGHDRLFSPAVHPCPYQSTFMQEAYSCRKCLVPEKCEDFQNVDLTIPSHFSNKNFGKVDDKKSTCTEAILTETQKEALAYIASVLKCGKVERNQLESCSIGCSKGNDTERSTASLKPHKSSEVDNRLLDPSKTYRERDMLLRSFKKSNGTPHCNSLTFREDFRDFERGKKMTFDESKCRLVDKSLSMEPERNRKQFCKSYLQTKDLPADVKCSSRTRTDKTRDFYNQIERPCLKQSVDAGIQTCACISKRKGECKCGSLSLLEKHKSKQAHPISSSCTDTRSGPSFKDDGVQTSDEAFTIKRIKKYPATRGKKEQMNIYAKSSQTETETASDSTQKVNKKCQIGNQKRTQNVSTSIGTSLLGSSTMRNTKGQQTTLPYNKHVSSSSSKCRKSFETLIGNCRKTMTMVSDDEPCSAVLTSSCSEGVVYNSLCNICPPRSKHQAGISRVSGSRSPRKECHKKKSTIYSSSEHTEAWCEDDQRDVRERNNDLKSGAVVGKFDKNSCGAKIASKENRPIVHITYTSKQTGGKPKCCAVPPSTNNKDLNEQLKRQISNIIQQTKALQQHAQQLKTRCVAAEEEKASHDTSANFSQGSVAEDCSGLKADEGTSQKDFKSNGTNKNWNANPRNIETAETNNVQRQNKYKRNIAFHHELQRAVSANHKLTADSSVHVNVKQKKVACHKNKDAREESIEKEMREGHKREDSGQRWNSVPPGKTEIFKNYPDSSHGYTFPQNPRYFVNDPSEEAYQYINANLPQISKSFRFTSGNDQMGIMAEAFKLGQSLDETHISEQSKQTDLNLQTDEENRGNKRQSSSNKYEKFQSVSTTSKIGSAAPKKSFSTSRNDGSSIFHLPNRNDKEAKHHQHNSNAKVSKQTRSGFAAQHFRSRDVIIKEFSDSASSCPKDSSGKSIAEVKTRITPYSEASSETSVSRNKENVSVNYKYSDGSVPSVFKSSGLWKSSSYVTPNSHTADSSLVRDHDRRNLPEYPARNCKRSSSQQNCFEDKKRQLEGNTGISDKREAMHDKSVYVSSLTFDNRHIVERCEQLQMHDVKNAITQTDGNYFENTKTVLFSTDPQHFCQSNVANKNVDSDASSHGIDDLPLDPVSNPEEHKLLHSGMTIKPVTVNEAPWARKRCSSSVSSHDHVLLARPLPSTTHSDINNRAASRPKTTTASTQTDRSPVSQISYTQFKRQPCSVISADYKITPRKQLVKHVTLNSAKSDNEKNNQTDLPELFSSELGVEKTVMNVPSLKKSVIKTRNKPEAYESPLVKWWNSKECLEERKLLNKILRNRESGDSLSQSGAFSAFDKYEIMTNSGVASPDKHSHETPFLRKRRISRMYPNLFEAGRARYLTDIPKDTTKEDKFIKTVSLENSGSPPPYASFAEQEQDSKAQDDSPDVQTQLEGARDQALGSRRLPESIFLLSKPRTKQPMVELSPTKAVGNQWCTCLLSCAEVTAANDDQVIIEGFYTGNHLSQEVSKILSTPLPKHLNTSFKARGNCKQAQTRSHSDHIVPFKLVLMRKEYTKTKKAYLTGTYFRDLLTSEEEFCWNVKVKQCVKSN